MEKKTKERQKVFGEVETHDDEYYVHNKNTGRLHLPGCSAIRLMNPDNIQETTIKSGGHCEWCQAIDPPKSRRNYVKKTFQEPLFFGAHDFDPEGSIECKDPFVWKVFNEVGCLRCGEKNFVIKMHPVHDEDDGHRLKDHKGKWWIYAECQERLNPKAKEKCGYQSAFWKVLHRYNMMHNMVEEHATENGGE